MADNRQINEEYAKIGAELIANDPALVDVKESDVTIVYLSSDHEKMDKGRAVLGQCEKVQDKYKWGIPADFTITLFEPNIEGKSQEAIRRIILHELLHVGIDSVRPHDIEDFKVLIDRWGTDWMNVDDSEFDIDIDEWKEAK